MSGAHFCIPRLGLTVMVIGIVQLSFNSSSTKYSCHYLKINHKCLKNKQNINIIILSIYQYNIIKISEYYNYLPVVSKEPFVDVSLVVNDPGSQKYWALRHSSASF